MISHRLSGKYSRSEKARSQGRVEEALRGLQRQIRVHSDSEPEEAHARRVVMFEGDAREIAAHEFHHDVLIEHEILHTVHPAMATMARRTNNPIAVRDLEVKVRGGRRPVSRATVTLFHGTTPVGEPQITDERGTASFHFPHPVECTQVGVFPPGGFWSVHEPVTGPAITVACPPLPQDGPLGWWHHVLGIERFNPRRGRGVRVGVADTGVGPHPCLDHVKDLGACVNGRMVANGADLSNHGTHVAGIIGARPRHAGQYGGIAPGVDLVAVRVFTSANDTNQASIAGGVEECATRHGIDLLNLSLGSEEPSRILNDAIHHAYEHGVLCICSVGNSGSSVSWPAGFKATIGVSALGVEGWGPPRATARAWVPQDKSRFGKRNLYVASFSCFGAGVSVAGPGVGIISTVPSGDGEALYSAMEGTSLASPAICGALAILLADAPHYRKLPRDETRAHRANLILDQHCRSAGVNFRYQGKGMLHLPERGRSR